MVLIGCYVGAEFPRLPELTQPRSQGLFPGLGKAREKSLGTRLELTVSRISGQTFCSSAEQLEKCKKDVNCKNFSHEREVSRPYKTCLCLVLRLEDL